MSLELSKWMSEASSVVAVDGDIVTVVVRRCSLSEDASCGLIWRQIRGTMVSSNATVERIAHGGLRWNRTTMRSNGVQGRILLPTSICLHLNSSGMSECRSVIHCVLSDHCVATVTTVKTRMARNRRQSPKLGCNTHVTFSVTAIGHKVALLFHVDSRNIAFQFFLNLIHCILLLSYFRAIAYRLKAETKR